MDAKTHQAVGELVQAATHHHGLTGPVEFRVLSEPPALAGGQLDHLDTEEEFCDD